MKCANCGATSVPYTYTIRGRGGYIDVVMCESCFKAYTPYLNRRGDIVFKRTGILGLWPPILYTFSSARLTDRVVALLDRVACNKLMESILSIIPWVFIGLGSAALVLLASSLLAYLTMSPDVLARMRWFYEKYPLAGVGLVGLDPIFPALELTIAVAIAITVHELGHALVLRRYRYAVRRIGLIFVAFIPVGAFVEGPGSIEARMSKREIMQLGGSGIFNNLFVAAICFGFFMLLMSGLSPVKPEAMASLLMIMNRPLSLIVPPQLLTLTGLYTPLTAPEDWYVHSWLGTSYTLPMNLLYYIFLINLYVAIMNALPIKPLDGGLMLYVALKDKVNPSRVDVVMTLVSVALLLMIVVPIMIQRGLL